jgi:hypothetical protein
MKTLYALSALALALFLAPAAKADSIVFESYNAATHTYTYDLELDHKNTSFDSNDGFQLTGLKGVTSAVLTGDLDDDFNVTFNLTSVTVTPASWRGVTESSRTIPYYLGTLTIKSLYAPGTVEYSLDDSYGNFCGDVKGPKDPGTSPVPEPSTLLMLGTGLLGAAGSLRRKLRS